MRVHIRGAQRDTSREGECKLKFIPAAAVSMIGVLSMVSIGHTSETGAFFCTAKSSVTCGKSGKCVVGKDPEVTISYKIGSNEFTRCFNTMGGRRCPPDDGQLIRAGKLYPSFDILQPTIGRWFRVEYATSGDAFFVFSYTLPSGVVTTINGPCDFIPG